MRSSVKLETGLKGRGSLYNRGGLKAYVSTKDMWPTTMSCEYPIALNCWTGVVKNTADSSAPCGY
jgi:hypothetical protein